MKYEVPFFANTEDDLHCVQASLKMILKYFEPEADFSWEELDKITGKDSAVWTWPLAMLKWLVDRGYDVSVHEVFDYEEFAERGGQYIIDNVGEEVGNAQIRNSNIPAEQERAKQLLGKIDKNSEIPTEQDIRDRLSEGYLVLCRVNSSVLNGNEDYIGHSIVVTGFDDSGPIINDPGLPPLKDRHVSSELFEKAWAYPVIYSRNVTAIRLPK